MKKYNPDLYLKVGKKSARNLTSAQGYQRPVNRSRVNRIKSEFDPYKLDPIKVCERHNEFYVFDGQHRLTALVEMFGEDVVVPVIIFSDIPYEKEAELFMTQDSDRSKLSVPERLRARYEAKEFDVIQFHDILTGYGFDVSFKSSGTPDSNTISSYAYLWKHIYNGRGQERLIDVMNIVVGAYGVVRISTQAELLQGVNCILDYYGDVLDRNRLIKVLQGTTPKEIKNIGKTDSSRKGEKRFGAYLVKLYNHRLGRNKLDILF